MPGRARIALLALMIALTPACGSLDDVRDTAQTVDEAVELLEDIDQNSAWQAVVDGLDALDAQAAGYVATLRLREAPLDAAGASGARPSREVTIAIQVDASRDALLQLTQDGVTSDYYVQDFGSAAGARAYRIAGGRYTCVTDEAGGLPLHQGISGVFSTYAAQATGAQVLAVTREAGEMSVAGREVTRYTLESRVPAALHMVRRTVDEESRAQFDQVLRFALSGDLALDTETGALLRFVANYEDLDAQRRSDFEFEILQWGDVPPIPAPRPDQIDLVCE